MPASTRRWVASALMAASALTSFGLADASAESRPATVVELFTSQGCNSCPPANANLTAISDDRDVLTLSFGVTYWDYLGWKDTFARKDFTARQVSYERSLGHRGPFTPQIVVNGRADVVGNKLQPLRSLISKSGRPADPAIHFTKKELRIGSGDAPAGGADIWLVRYDPRTLSVPVGRGENSGHTLPHSHVVRDLKHLGIWQGAVVTIALPPADTGLKTAVLVQRRKGGPILSAARD